LFICLDLFFWPNQVGKMLPGRSMTEKTAKSSRKHPDQIQPLKSNQNPRGMVHVEEAPQVHAEPTAGKLGPHGFDDFQGREGEGLGLTGVDLSSGDEHETNLGASVEELQGAVVVGEDR
jgi:hypothetical protein